jgi:hypothetical protein
VDHQEAGVAMKGRGQAMAAVFIVVLVAVGGVYLQREVGPRAAAAGPPGSAPSGAWFCPHGGGTDWTVSLEVANPGPEQVPIRVQTLGEGKPTSTKSYVVKGGTELLVPVPADSRERSSIVEYFGGWVAAGWLAHAGGGEGGTGAEPCMPDAGTKWVLPGGTTVEHEDSYVVVMNPFAADAVFSVTLLSEKPMVSTAELTYVPLKPYRSVAFHLNDTLLDRTTVSAELDVKVGRVAAAMLGVSDVSGVRSTDGILGDPPARSILPGGFDQGRTDLAVMNTTSGRVTLGGSLLQSDGDQPLGSLTGSSPVPDSAQTYPITTDGPSTIDLQPSAPVATARRTYGVVSDSGSTVGAAAPTPAWVILPAVAGEPSHPGLVLADPGDEPAEVTLSFLPSGAEPSTAPITVTVPARRTVAVPADWIGSEPLAAVLAVASSGTFVPAAASYSLGREGYATYAVSLGVPIPDAWVPA